MEPFDIIVVIVGIIVLAVIIKKVTKILLKIIGFLFVTGFVIFVLFFWHGGLVNLNYKNFMLKDLKKKYCTEQVDIVKCDCIIKPLLKDVKSKHSFEELNRLEKDKIAAIKVIFKSAKEKKDEIMECLKENEATEKWDEVMDELKGFKIQRK